MAIAVGDKLPDANFSIMTKDGPGSTTTAEAFAGKTVALFGLPGAYTGPCTSIHMPSFVKAADDLRAKGVDAVICTAVNDPFVLKAWGEATGATAAGISFLGDAEAAFAKALDLTFTAPHAGLIDRSKRYSMLVKDGVVEKFNLDDNPGEPVCSRGDALLEML